MTSHNMHTRRRQLLKLVILLIWCIVVSSQTRAQEMPTAEYQIRAVYLYNFSKFVKWPNSVFVGLNSPFIIGVLGTDPFGTLLDRIVAGETYEGHHMVIKRFNKIEDVDTCHILYVASPGDGRLATRTLAGLHVLTVGEESDFVANGGIMRFVNYDNKVRIQINLTRAKDENLDISSKLLKLAEVIEP